MSIVEKFFMTYEFSRSLLWWLNSTEKWLSLQTTQIGYSGSFRLLPTCKISKFPRITNKPSLLQMCNTIIIAGYFSGEYFCQVYHLLSLEKILSMNFSPVLIYCICSNISPGFYFLPGSGDPASKRDRPLVGTGVYKVTASTNNQKYKKIIIQTSQPAVSLDVLAIPTAREHWKSR